MQMHDITEDNEAGRYEVIRDERGSAKLDADYIIGRIF